MKKAVLFMMMAVTSVLTISTSAKAQKGFYVSAHGGPQLSVMFNSDDVDKPNTDYKSKSSHAFGIGAGYQFTQRAGVGTEVMYSVARQKYVNNNTEYTQQFNYLKVPVLFTYNSDPASMVMFTAKAGPQVGFLLKSKISEADDHSFEGETTNQYRNITAGAAAGFGARVRVADNLFVDAGLRFDGSFTNAENKSYAGYVPGRAKTYDLNTGIDVGIRYTFN